MAEDDTATPYQRDNLTYDSLFNYAEMVVARGSIERGVLKTNQPVSAAPVQVVPEPVTEQLAVRAEEIPLSVPLIKRDRVWIVLVSVGEPHSTQYEVLVDTGVGIFWTTHRPQHSTSAKPLLSQMQYPALFTIYQRSGGFVVAQDYRDHISLTTIETIVQGKARVSFANNRDAKPLYNGVLGLALSTTGVSFVTNFLPARGIKPIVALYLGPPGSGSQLHLGGPHPHYHLPETLEYHDVTRSRKWEIETVSLRVNDKLVAIKGVKTAFHTSTRFIYGPAHDVEKIYEALRAHGTESSRRGKPKFQGAYDTFPCKNQHKITFKWNSGREWELIPEQFNMGEIGDGICQGVIKKLKIAFWYMGNSFLGAYYTVYDGHSRIPRFGLAEKVPHGYVDHPVEDGHSPPPYVHHPPPPVYVKHPPPPAYVERPPPPAHAHHPPPH
ncbi:hypothetical protein APHAL10511_004124 [Amanita phalloides]|nr:hypothetical protein APHAL10511_004124 [Amanita phalloides]